MPSCEIMGTSFAARITFDAVQDIASNSSGVRVTKLEMRSLREMSLPCYILGSIYINGTKAANLAFTNTESCGVQMTQNYAGGGVGDPWFSGFSSSTVTVSHGADGSARIPVYAELFVRYNGQQLGYGINSTVYCELPRVPRVTELAAEGFVLGQKMTLRLSRAATDFTDTVSWSCGGMAGTLAEKTGEVTLEWVPPMELAGQAPWETAVAVTLTVTTFQGDTQVGSRTVEVSCRIPETVVPTMTVTVSDKTAVFQSYGVYIQSQSQAWVQTQAAGAYGSVIREIRVGCGGMTAAGESAVFALENSGSIPISVTVTDSRGRTASYEAEIQVQPYEKPEVTILGAFRCDEQGVYQADGQWLRVVFDAGASQTLIRTIRYYGICTVHGGTERRELELTDYSGQSSVAGGSFLMSAGLDTAYDCQVAVQDDFGRVTSSSVMICVSFALLDLCRGTKAVGIGTRARNPGKLSIGLDTDMEEHRIGNMAEPMSDRDGATKGYADMAAKKAAGRNLLDNSNFRNPVNQRGKTVYSTGWGVTIDRWYLGHSKENAGEYATLSIQDGGIHLTKSDPGDGESYIYLQTRIPKSDIDPGKYHTLGYKTNAGVGISVLSPEVIRGAVDSHGFLPVSIELREEDQFFLEWAALYQGVFTAETLPEYGAKGYASELMACMRCYQTVRLLLGADVGAPARFFTRLPVEMRSVPAVTTARSDGDGTVAAVMQDAGTLDTELTEGSWAHIHVQLSAEL